MDRETERIRRILKQNENKSFVQRILNPDGYPKLDLGDGDYATHKMAWSSVTKPDGKEAYRVYPTVLYDGEQLVDYGDKAYDEVLKTGNYIEFNNSKDADWFSKNYKKAMGGGRK